MDDSGSVRADAPRASQKRARLSWLALLLIAIGALTLVAVHAPPVAKKLVLFTIAFGLTSGGIGAWLATLLDLKQPAKWPWPLVVFGIVLAGSVGMALESHRLQRVAAQQAILADPKRLALMRLQDQARASGDTAAQ